MSKRIQGPEACLLRLEKIARGHGGSLLSHRYENEDSAMRYRCAQGHEFSQRAADTTRGSWCRECFYLRHGESRKAPARASLYRIAAERGGKVLSPAYVNSQTRLEFRCAQGHEWKTTPNAILQGQWCRRCAIAAITYPNRPASADDDAMAARFDRIVRDHGGEILAPGYMGFKRRIPVRCERGHTWDARPEGLQKGVWCPQCSRDAWMLELRELAARRGGECLAESCRSGMEIVQWRCALGHRFSKSGVVVKRGSWCPECRSQPPGDLERMQRIARERGGLCLSRRYVDAATHLRWRCREGHVWRATPGDIVGGHWCKTCGWWRSYSRERLSIHDMRETAAERGGQCLSSAYHGNKVPLRWRCARGHAWMAHPNRIRQGSWCPQCSHAARGTLKGLQALAVERGGRCVSRSWDDHSRTLEFECARGHRFHALGNVVKTGAWCPRCAPPSRRRV